MPKKPKEYPNGWSSIESAVSCIEIAEGVELSCRFVAKLGKPEVW